MTVSQIKDHQSESVKKLIDWLNENKGSSNKRSNFFIKSKSKKIKGIEPMPRIELGTSSLPSKSF